MNSQRQNSSPHVLATIGSITILTLLPIFLYFVLIFTANDIGGPLNLILIPCSNLIAAILFTLIFSFPLSKLLDWLLQKASHNGQSKTNSFLLSTIPFVLVLILVVGVFFFAIGIVMENHYVLRILDGQDVDSVMLWLIRFLFLGGVPFLLGGVTYWFILQTSRKVLSNRGHKPELIEYQNAG